jgi:hypothetical protein
MTTEAKVQAALEAWADTVEPSAGAWTEHARRMRTDRRRRTALAVGTAAAMVAGVAGVAVGLSPGRQAARPPAHRPAPTISPPEFVGPDLLPTSAVVPIGSVPNVGDYFVYWSHGQSCFAVTHHGRDASEGCSPTRPTTGDRALQPAWWDSEISTAVVRPDVASASLRTAAGTYIPARIVTGKGFPARLAVVLDRRVTGDARWLAADAAGRLLPTGQPFALEIHPVIGSSAGKDCANFTMNGELLDDPASGRCYALAWTNVEVTRTTAATASNSATGASSDVTVTLRPADAQRLATLTGEVMRHKRPHELAFVLDGKLLMVAPLAGRISDGRFELDAGFDQRRASEIAAELSGG